MIYDVYGNPIYPEVGGTDSYILVGAVLDASSDNNRFLAMKQLFDIARRKIADPSSVISDSDFTYATKGSVGLFPKGHSAMYERYPFVPIYSKNADVQAVPASVTKAMTLVTGLDYVDSIKEVVTIKSSDVIGGSGNYFSAGDTMTIEELMLAMMLPSSNTCANAFARICGDKILNSEQAGTYTDAQCTTRFITEMNKKASYIGMNNSTFDNASGASGSTNTTCTDLILLTLEASSYPEICKVWNKKTYSISVGGSNPRTVELTSTVQNATLESSYYIFGGKTGSLTSPASRSLILIAEPK